MARDAANHSSLRKIGLGRVPDLGMRRAPWDGRTVGAPLDDSGWPARMSKEEMVVQEQDDGKQETYETVPFRIHPRVFAALGANLVTDDVVAVIELIKNSYDAFAQNVWLRFIDDPVKGRLLEITDDGSGMTRQTIEEVWVPGGDTL